MPSPTFTTYDGLIDTIRDWALPGGTLPEFETNIPNFVRIAEARFDLELRCANMIGTSMIETDNALIAVPDDWLETISVSIPGYGELKSITIGQEAHARPGYDRGWPYNARRPTAFAMMDGAIRVLPAPVANVMQAYELVYYRKVSKLGDDQASNWIISLHPQLYLYASLAAAKAYLVDSEQIGLWAQSAGGIIETINAQSARAEYARSHTPTRQLTFG